MRNDRPMRVGGKLGFFDMQFLFYFVISTRKIIFVHKLPFMILQIRTKDNLADLKRHGNSPSWVISESRINLIESVEIYQFDGKRVLKGIFNKNNSYRNADGRLVVAFSNGIIEDCDFKWIGQNPIKYNSVNTAVNKTDSINNSNFVVGFYAGKINDYENVEECCFAGEKPDFIAMGIVLKHNGENEFIGKVITNWCDKYPSDSLLYNGKSTVDMGGIAEDDNGNNLWETVQLQYPHLLPGIDELYNYLEIDADDEHYNLSAEIPDELRLFNIYEGSFIDFSSVKKGSGETLGVQFYL